MNDIFDQQWSGEDKSALFIDYMTSSGMTDKSPGASMDYGVDL